MPARTLKDEMIALEAREDELNAVLANRPAAEPALHPNLANIYRKKVAANWASRRFPGLICYEYFCSAPRPNR